MTLENIYQAVKAITADEKGNSQYSTLNEMQIAIKPENLLCAVETLLNNGVRHLSTITGCYEGKQLTLLYHFWKKEGFTLRIYLEQGKQEIHTITELIPGAAFYEREVAEMFGIQINGLDTSQKLFLPDNWQGDAPMHTDFRTTENNDTENKEKGEK